MCVLKGEETSYPPEQGADLCVGFIYTEKQRSQNWPPRCVTEGLEQEGGGGREESWKGDLSLYIMHLRRV